MASQVSEHAETMRRMVDDLLELAAIRWSGGMTVSPASMDLLPLCCELVDEMKVIHPAREFTLNYQGDLTGEWDQARLRQLLSNLLGNAAQHGSPDAPVVLSVDATEFDVRLAVRNCGNAIPEEQVATLFDPFKHPLVGPISRRPGGAGLGLYIAREVVTAHQGSIHVHSDPEATVFVVRLPRQCR